MLAKYAKSPAVLAETGQTLPVVTVESEPFFNLANSRLQKHSQIRMALIKSILWAHGCNVPVSAQSDFAMAGFPELL
jgi:hypothetical protein